MLSRSNSTSNNSAPSARDYGSYDPNSYYGQIVPSGSQFSRTNTNPRASFDEPRSFGRRTSSFGSARLPSQHGSLAQIIILNPQPQPQRDQSNPAWRGPPTRAAPGAASVENSLRKEFYNPSTKRITNTVNLYYRDTPVNPRDLSNYEDGKRCTVCLEDFERGLEVTLTPCNHMFHHDCIVPWAKTNPQCPVCRFDFGPKVVNDRSSSSLLPFSNTNHSGGGGGGGGGSSLANMAGPGLTMQEFLSVMRALGDGFQW